MWAVNEADLSVQTAPGYVYVVMLHYGLGVGLAVADLLPLLPPPVRRLRALLALCPCMRSRTSLFCCKLSSVCNFRLAIFSLMQVQYSTMYCITTKTLCTTENNVHYSALTDWPIYHVAWFRTVPFTSELYTFWKKNGLRFEHEKAIQRDET